MVIQEYLPVAISVVIIVLVAVLEKRSKLVAAVTATMPIKVPLALWVVYAANQGQQEIMEGFSRSLVVGILPTIAFLVAAWLSAKAGLKLIPTLLIGYLVWGVGVGLTFFYRTVLGV